MNAVCFIPSKGRPQTSTHRFFAEHQIPVVHVVEPQDAAAYRANHLSVVELPANDRGLVFSRNWILDYATQQGVEIAFVCDDDVTMFGRVIDKKIRADVSVLQTMIDLLKANPRIVAGLEYQQLAWAHEKPFTVNRGWIDVCIGFRPADITARYDPHLELKEDRDWQLQNLANGIDLVRYNHGCFACPSIGTNEGGLHDKYAAKLDHGAAKRMVDKWSPFVRLHQKPDRIDVKANWPLLVQHYRKRNPAHA